jgi:hypothetical protein
VKTTRAIGLLADTAGRFEVWEAEAGAGTPVVWAEQSDLAWGYFGAQEESALGTAWVRSLFEEPERARELSGVFALVAVDRARGRVLAVGDRLGVQGVYYARVGGSTWRVSTHLMWLLQDLGHDGSVDPEGFVAHMGFGYTGRSVYRGVEKLGPAAHAVWSGEEVAARTYWTGPEASEAQMEVLGEALRAATPCEAVLGVTAGKDSLALAAAMAGGPPRWTGTFGVEGCSDHLQGREISARLGTEQLTAGVCGAEDFGCWASHIAFHSAGLATASYVDMAAFVGRTVPPGATFVMGEGGECVRRFFGASPVATLTQQYMTPVEYLRRTLALPVEAYPAGLVEAVRRPMGPVSDDTFALRFYRMVRMPGNFSLRQAVLAPLGPKVSPFLDSRFLDGAYGLSPWWYEDSRLHRALVERLRPEFLDLFDAPAQAAITTQDWEGRFALGIGEQVGRMLEEALPECGDVFCAEGVRTLLERPGRAVYHLLRVVSFARARQMLRNVEAISARG